MVERAMQTTKNQAQKAKSDDEWHKDDSRTFGRLPKIIRPPAKRLGSVLVQHKAGGQPNGKHRP